MSTSAAVRTVLAALGLTLVGLCGAQTAPHPPADVQREPDVKHILVEDDTNRIEELRVRGETQRIVVQPKRAGASAYEVIPADRGRDMSQGAGSGRGAAGKSVWSFFKF